MICVQSPSHHHHHHHHHHRLFVYVVYTKTINHLSICKFYEVKNYRRLFKNPFSQFILIFIFGEAASRFFIFSGKFFSLSSFFLIDYSIIQWKNVTNFFEKGQKTFFNISPIFFSAITAIIRNTTLECYTIRIFRIPEAFQCKNTVREGQIIIGRENERKLKKKKKRKRDSWKTNKREKLREFLVV